MRYSLKKATITLSRWDTAAKEEMRWEAVADIELETGKMTLAAYGKTPATAFEAALAIAERGE